MSPAIRRELPWHEASPLPIGDAPPPSNVTHERLVNQAVLALPGFLARVSPPLLAEHFFSNQERLVFEGAAAVERETGSIGVVAVAEWIKAKGRLGEFPDLKSFEVANLISEHRGILTSTDIEHALAAARSVFNLAQQRALALHCQQALGVMYAGRVESPKSFFEAFEAKASEFCRVAVRSQSTTTATEGVREALKELFDPKSDPGISSGLAAYDEALGFMRAGEYTVLGGSTGHGKTAMGLTIAGNVALRGHGVLYVKTADEAAKQLSLRLLCSWAGVWASKVRRKQLAAHEFASIQRAAERFNNLPLKFDDAHGQTIQEIDSQVRREAIAFERDYSTKLRLVVIDYIQACRYLGSTSRQTEESILKAVSKHAHDIATKHGVHVMGLVQSWPIPPNAKEGDGKPDLNHIKGCKAIAHEAENVAFIHRIKENGKYPVRGRAELVIRKARWGGVEDVPLIFDGPLTRFEDDPDRPEVER